VRNRMFLVSGSPSAASVELDAFEKKGVLYGGY
jgi:hypothetical protein